MVAAAARMQPVRGLRGRSPCWTKHDSPRPFVQTNLTPLARLPAKRARLRAKPDGLHPVFAACSGGRCRGGGAARMQGLRRALAPRSARQTGAGARGARRDPASAGGRRASGGRGRRRRAHWCIRVLASGDCRRVVPVISASLRLRESRDSDRSGSRCVMRRKGRLMRSCRSHALVLPEAPMPARVGGAAPHGRVALRPPFAPSAARARSGGGFARQWPESRCRRR